MTEDKERPRNSFFYKPKSNKYIQFPILERMAIDFSGSFIRATD